MESKDEKTTETTLINLPFDVIDEILSWLPVKYLLRSKCVCKYWCNLIESQYFIKLHLSKSKESDGNGTCIIVDHWSLHTIDFNSSDNYATSLYCPDHWPRYGKAPILELIGSYNGLICLYEGENRTISLYNPATRVYKQIPLIKDKMPEEKYTTISHQGDFCYDCVANDYKVFYFISYFKDLDESSEMVGMESHAFSLKSNSWERMPNPPLDTNQIHSVFTNNFLHWLAFDNYNDGDESNVILRMNVSTRRYDTMLLPTECSCVVVLKGNLHLLKVIGKVEIWIMKEYGVEQTWTRLFHGNTTLFDLSLCAIPYAYSKDGRKIHIGLDEEHSINYACFDLESQAATEYVIEFLPKNPSRGFFMEPWVESLVSPIQNKLEQ